MSPFLPDPTRSLPVRLGVCFFSRPGGNADRALPDPKHEDVVGSCQGPPETASHPHTGREGERERESRESRERE
eukprot:scaffold86_cov338-Pavlova_lutheri.AAC.49